MNKKRLIYIILGYGGLLAVIISFISFRVANLYHEYVQLENELLVAQARAQEYKDDVARVKKLLSLMQENSEHLSREHEQALAFMLEKRNTLHDEIRALKARNELFEKQLHLAQQRSLPKQQLVISRALLSKHMQNLLQRVQQVQQEPKTT